MLVSPTPPEPGPKPGEWFATTHWSVVGAAGQVDSARRAEALERLCRTYWYPLFAFVCRRGHSLEDAQDLTQEFFARLLDKNYVQTADPERGRFRTFLLTALKGFLANEWDRGQAQKRGGGRIPLPLEDLTPEQLHHLSAQTELTPEQAYERNWALALLEQARREVRDEYAAAGKLARFGSLEPFLPGDRQELTYAQVGASLGLSEEAVKSEVHRMKRRFREVVRTLIAHSVETPEEIDDEVRHLFAALAGLGSGPTG